MPSVDEMLRFVRRRPRIERYARDRGRGAILPAAIAALALVVSGCATGGAGGAALECPPVAELEPLLAPGKVVLVGEMHGTSESPAFVGDLACHGLAAGRTVVVALEIPWQEGERVERFLDSAGGETDRSALLAGAFWQDRYQDGRRSRAKLALLDRLRALRAAEWPVGALLLDDATTTSGVERDRLMAERLTAAAEEHPRGMVVALTGNLHNRVVRGLPWDAEHESMGYLATRRLAAGRITSLDVSSAGGTAWFCTGSEAASCGVQSLGGSGPADAAAAVELYAQHDDSGYHGVYRVGRLTASPPAVAGAGPGGGG